MEYLGLEWARSREGYVELKRFLHGWGLMITNDVGWPTFDGKFVSYVTPPLRAHRSTYHGIVAKNLRERNA
jgi:hypothetical protein